MKPELTVWETRQQRDLLSRALKLLWNRGNQVPQKTGMNMGGKQQDRLKVSLSNEAFSLLTHSTVMAPAASWRLILQKKGVRGEGDK